MNSIINLYFFNATKAQINTTYLQNGHFAKAVSKAKWSNMVHFGNELQNAKTVRETTLGTHYSCMLYAKKHLIFEKLKVFAKWQKWSIFNRYNKAKWSKLAYIGDELQSDKNIRKTTLEAHSTVLE